MMVVCGGTKGGTGKSTMAVNLAVIASSTGADVLLVDADDQESASDFSILRNETQTDAGYTSIKLTGAAVRTELQRLAPKYDHVLIDTGGRDTTSQRAALTVANVLLVPFLPRSFDVWVIGRVAGIVDEVRAVNPELKAYAFLNRADPRGRDNIDAAEVIRESAALEFIDAPIGQRKAFANAAAQGLVVTELKPQDPKATAEIMTLFQRVFNVTPTSQ